jgi:predicted transcriptional regulator
MKATAFRLDEQVLIDLKKIAKEQERSINWLVNNTLKNFIEGEKKKKKKN